MWSDSRLNLINRAHVIPKRVALRIQTTCGEIKDIAARHGQQEVHDVIYVMLWQVDNDHSLSRIIVKRYKSPAVQSCNAYNLIGTTVLEWIQ